MSLYCFQYLGHPGVLQIKYRILNTVPPYFFIATLGTVPYALCYCVLCSSPTKFISVPWKCKGFSFPWMSAHAGFSTWTLFSTPFPQPFCLSKSSSFFMSQLRCLLFQETFSYSPNLERCTFWELHGTHIYSIKHHFPIELQLPFYLLYLFAYFPFTLNYTRVRKLSYS